MQHVLTGISIGLTLAVLLGPLFILLIQASIEYGSKGGLIAAAGIWVSDLIFVVLALNFVNRLSSLINSESFSYWLGIAGGVILIGIGIATFFRKASMEFGDTKNQRSGLIGYWIKGFMVNTFNPFTFFFWLLTIPSLSVNRGLDQSETWLLSIGVLCTIVFTDSLKIALAKLIRKVINIKILTRINKIAGVALIIFGFVLLLNSVK